MRLELSQAAGYTERLTGWSPCAWICETTIAPTTVATAGGVLHLETWGSQLLLIAFLVGGAAQELETPQYSE